MQPTSTVTPLRAAGALAAVGVLGLGAWLWWKDAESAEIAASRAARSEREQAARLTRQREESASLMPDVLEGVSLGMSVAEVRAGGHAIERAAAAAPEGLPLEMYEERLPNGAQIMFGFSDTTGRLQQVQVMSLLPRLDAIALHLSAMNERYGTPSGVWDCPDTQGLPTRRFTWRHAQTAIADVFLVYNGRASLTLYLATPEIIGRSLRMSRCEPVPRERLDQFPTATPEQIQRAAAQSGG